MKKEITAEDKAMVVAFGALRRKAEGVLYEAGDLTKKVEDLRAEWNNSRKQRLSLEGMLGESMRMLEILSKSLGLFMDMRGVIGDSPDLRLAFTSAEASLKEYETWLARAMLIQSLEGLDAQLEALEALKHVDHETMDLTFGFGSPGPGAFRCGVSVIEPYKGREIDHRKPVFVHRNLTRSGVTYSVLQGGEVVAHARRIVLRDCEFSVLQSGRERYVRTGRRNVHAGVKGYITETNPTTMWSPAVEVTYSPDNDEFFKDPNGEKVTSARLVLLDAQGLQALDPLVAEKAV